MPSLLVHRVAALCSGAPLHPLSFSGSVRQFLLALERARSLAGAFDVDEGRGTTKGEWLRAVRRARRLRGARLLARWNEASIRARSERARNALARAADPTAALLYGTDFFPARAGEAPRVPVGAALDATFAQLARSGESYFGHLRPREIDRCVGLQGDTLARCAVLFPRTEWCARSLTDDYGVPRERIVVTGAGPALDEPPAPRNGYDGRSLLFVGRDWFRKNGPLVLDAFRLARGARPDLRLRIVGPRHSGDSADGVEWLGPLDGAARARLPELYAASSLFLCPSRFEPFGLVLVEAMAHGCPVLALDRGAAREIVVPGITGDLLRDDEPRTLSKAILEWLGDPERLARAGAAAQALVEKRFRWDLAVSRVLAGFAGRHPDPLPPVASVLAPDSLAHQPK